jgi:phosphoribosyl 1,2-cyclic phosphodiesterase
MFICGVDIKGTEAVVCILEYREGVFFVPDCRVRKVEFSKRNRSSDLAYFQSTFAKLMTDYKVDKVVIKERPLTGKFSGGGLGFKMEAALQLIANLDIETISQQHLKASLKRNPVTVNFVETGLKVFQEHAFQVAYASHMNTIYPEKDSAAAD